MNGYGKVTLYRIKEASFVLALCVHELIIHTVFDIVNLAAQIANGDRYNMY